MKTKSLVRILTLCAVVQLTPLTLAQNPAKADNAVEHGGRWRQKLAGLSAPERHQLRAAHLKAMQDPAVRSAQLKMRQAHREFRDTQRAAMLKADPSIEPVLNKIPEGRGRRDS